MRLVVPDWLAKATGGLGLARVSARVPSMPERTEIIAAFLDRHGWDPAQLFGNSNKMRGEGKWMHLTIAKMI